MIIESFKNRHTLPVDVDGFLMPAEVEETAETTEKWEFIFGRVLV